MALVTVYFTVGGGANNEWPSTTIIINNITIYQPIFCLKTMP